MSKHAAVIGLMAAVLLFAANARAEDNEKEASAELEIGSASEWGLAGGEASFGPSAALEFNAIKDRLEIEVGVAPLFDRGQTEWNTELIFKTPLISYGNIEVTLGMGPEWQHRSSGEEKTNSMSGETELDFQVWRPDRKFGWFVQPSYGYSFSSDHEQSLGVTMGLLIAIP